MTSDLRHQADWLAGAGFLAAAPNLLYWGRGSGAWSGASSVAARSVFGSGAMAPWYAFAQRRARASIQTGMAGAVCEPNISAAGRRRRNRVGYVASALGVAFVVLSAVLHWAWYVRAGTVFAPAALAATGFLQAARRTCIARAAEGTFENEDFSTTPAPAEEVVASRRVAASIRRDAVLIGLAASAVAAASALV